MDARFERSIDWSKMDPGLSAAISEAVDREQRLRIIFSTRGKLRPGSIEFMRKRGVIVSPSTLRDGENILTAYTTMAGIRDLSRRPYVTQISKARQLVPAQGQGPRIRVEIV